MTSMFRRSMKSRMNLMMTIFSISERTSLPAVDELPPVGVVRRDLGQMAMQETTRSGANGEENVVLLD